MEHYMSATMMPEQIEEFRDFLDNPTVVAPVSATFDDGAVIIIGCHISDDDGEPLIECSLHDREDGEHVATLHPFDGGTFPSVWEFAGVRDLDTYVFEVFVDDVDEDGVLYTTTDRECIVKEGYAAFKPGMIEIEHYW